MLAQGYLDLATAGYGFGPNGEYSAFNRYNIAAKIPWILDEEKTNIILFNISANQTDVENEGQALDYSMGNVTFNPAYNRKINDRHTLTIMIIGRWNGRNIGLNSEDFQLGGLAIWSVKLSDTYTHKFGMYANDDLFSPFVTPFYGVDWKINSKTRFSGNLPIMFTFSHQLKKRVVVGVNYNGLITSFRLESTYIERRVLNMGPFVDWYLTGSIVVRGHIGYLIGSSFDEYAIGDRANFSFSIFKFGDNRNQISSIDVKGMFITASLIYRVKTE